MSAIKITVTLKLRASSVVCCKISTSQIWIVFVCFFGKLFEWQWPTGNLGHIVNCYRLVLVIAVKDYHILTSDLSVFRRWPSSVMEELLLSALEAELQSK